MASERNRWLILFVGLLAGVNVCVPCSDKFFIVNKSTNKCIDVSGYPGIDDRATIQTWNCELNHAGTDQLWRMDRHGRLISVASGKCMDVAGFVSNSNGANIQLYTCEDPNWRNTDHTWEFHYHEHEDDFFQIRNKKTNKCVDVSGWSASGNGKNVQQWDCESYYIPNTDHWWFKVYLE